MRRLFSYLGETVLKLAAGFMLVGIFVGLSQDAGEARRGIGFVYGPVALGVAPVTVPIQARSPDGHNGSLIDVLSHLGDKERLYLVMSALQTDRQPGVTYDVFMNMPSDTPASEADRYLVGNLNFFNVRSGAKTNRPSFISFDVTAAARTMLQRRSAVQTATVTIIPAGSPSVEAHPIVGRIELVPLQK